VPEARIFGLNLMGIDPYWQGTAVGCISVAAAAGERLLSGRRSAA
jgi:ribose transport system permease protein